MIRLDSEALRTTSPLKFDHAPTVISSTTPSLHLTSSLTHVVELRFELAHQPQCQGYGKTVPKTPYPETITSLEYPVALRRSTS